MKIRIEYDGWMAEELNKTDEIVSFDIKTIKVFDLINHLKETNGAYESVFKSYEKASYLAVNGNECFDENQVLNDNDQVVFHMHKVGG